MNITREVPAHLQEEYDRIIKELKRTRQRMDISQADIAQKCGISFSTVSAIERGVQNCSTTTLIGYLWALHLSYSDLEKPKAGTLTCMYFVIYGLGRLLIEGLRTDSIYIIPGIRVSQVLSLFLICGGILLYIFFVRRNKTKNVYSGRYIR